MLIGSIKGAAQWRLGNLGAFRYWGKGEVGKIGV